MSEPCERGSAARRLLAEDGPLARHFEGYEARPGQLELTSAVERALAEDGILLCEAGTGTGKTLAYLVPALLSGRKVVVSTATRALQEQIATRDIPLIRRALGLPAEVAVMKGLGNYLCLRRFGEASQSLEATAPGRRRSLELVERWRRGTETGDVAELDALSEDDPIWREVTSSSETRVGGGCSYFRDCFVTRMKLEAEAARVVVVNHHLFFADLALRGAHPGRVLPNYDAVIFDEAHQLESIATDFFGSRVSTRSLHALARDAERALLLGARAGAGAVALRARGATDDYFRELRRAAGASSEGRVLLDREVFAGGVADRWHRLDETLEEIESSARGDSANAPAASRAGADDALEVVARRAAQARESLRVITAGEPGFVTFLESSARSVAVVCSPVDLAPMLRVRVFESVPCVVLTSATLSTSDAQDQGFRYVRRRLGLDERFAVSELTVPSPFDLQRQALLYTPRDLPSPRDAQFVDAAAARSAELVEIVDGGAFVLTTSLRSMHDLATRLRDLLPTREVLLQGDMPKTALLERFRASGHAVLVATLGFWEGVDVPGRALRLVILEKVPFSVPTDPVLRARAVALESEGGNPFMDLVVPQAAITLKQGFGRLIRSTADTGIVALLDERVHRHGYGKKLLRALPPVARTDSLDEVRRFAASLAP